MTVIGLSDNGYREYKFSFKATVTSLFVKRQPCSPDCLRMKVKSQTEMFAMSHLVSSPRTLHSPASPKCPSSTLFWGKNAFSLNVLCDPH